jgi:Tol biopolymer transport system component
MNRKACKNTIVKAVIFTVTMLLTALSAKAASGPYFGQTPPGSTPQVFAPGIVSLTNRLECHIAFSPDGNECYFTVYSNNYSTCSIYYAEQENNIWSTPARASFSTGTYDLRPSLSVDGNKLFFSRAANSSSDENIYMMQRTTEGWSTPQALTSPINSAYHDFEYSESTSGVAYFASNRPGGSGGFDIWRINQSPGQPLEVVNIGSPINSSYYEFSPCIAPDGSYLLFASDRPGASDLYVSFDNNGVWAAPVNMNTYSPGINSVYDESAPVISPDGRYLFFSRHISLTAFDIYWVANPFYVPPPACVDPPSEDLNSDCKVDFEDFAIFANSWLDDYEDLAVFTSGWLDCGLEPSAACNQ